MIKNLLHEFNWEILIVWCRVVLLVVFVMLLEVGKMDGFENYIQEVNRQI